MHWTVSNYVFGKITIEIPTQKQLIALPMFLRWINWIILKLSQRLSLDGHNLTSNSHSVSIHFCHVCSWWMWRTTIVRVLKMSWWLTPLLGLNPFACVKSLYSFLFSLWQHMLYGKVSLLMILGTGKYKSVPRYFSMPHIFLI